MSNLNNILSHSACLSQEQMLQYLDKKLEQEEIYAVEEHVTDCMFCSDAFDGLAGLPSAERATILAEIKSHTETKIEEHIQSLEEENKNKLVAHAGGKSRKHWVAAASLLLLMFGGGAALFSYFNDHHQKEIQLAKNDKTVPVSNEKATIKEGSRELSTISMDESELDVREDEIVAKNDRPKSKKRKDRIVAEEEKNTYALPSPTPTSAPIIANSKNIIKEKSPLGNTNAGASVDDNSNYRIAPAQKKEDVIAKVDAERKASDFSSMNTADIPKYKGKLKTTPQQNNLYVDKKEKRREAESVTLSEVQKTTQSQGSFGKDKVTFTNYEQGYALYLKGQYKKSIRYFKKALRKKDAKNVEDTKYYLALALIQDGKEKEADALLAELEQGSRFKESAKKTRKKLSK